MEFYYTEEVGGRQTSYKIDVLWIPCLRKSTSSLSLHEQVLPFATGSEKRFFLFYWVLAVRSDRGDARDRLGSEGCVKHRLSLQGP